MLPSSNLPWQNSRQAHNMTHSSSIEHGRQLCAWASLARPGSYLQRSTGCLLTLDKAALPWDRPDSCVWRHFRDDSAPLWPEGRNTITQSSSGSQELSFLIPGNSVAWSNFRLFFRYTSSLLSVTIICWTQSTENRTFLCLFWTENTTGKRVCAN